MKQNTALLIGGSAAGGLVANRTFSPKVTLGTSLGAGLLYFLTKSKTAGAVALGTGGAWLVDRYG